MKRTSLVTLFALCLLLPLHAQNPAAEDTDITVQNDLLFGNGGNTELRLNLAMPKNGTGPHPAIVCVHGGGWRHGKRQDLQTLIETLARKGFVAVTVSYRLTDKAKFPAQIEDVKAAVRWLRANAKKYKVNPDKIGAVGFSAGGHLVSLLGAADTKAGLEGNGGHKDQSSRVQAVVSFFGPTDFIVKRWDDKVEGYFLVPLFGGKYDDLKDRYAAGSPQKYVSKDDPPFLFIHGDRDPLVGLHNSVDMAAKLRKAGVPAEVMIMKGLGHGWGGKAQQQTLDRTIQFFNKTLKK